jgi:hypothetical protein
MASLCLVVFRPSALRRWRLGLESIPKVTNPRRHTLQTVLIESPITRWAYDTQPVLFGRNERDPDGIPAAEAPLTSNVFGATGLEEGYDSLDFV